MQPLRQVNHLIPTQSDETESNNKNNFLCWTNTVWTMKSNDKYWKRTVLLLSWQCLSSCKHDSKSDGTTNKSLAGCWIASKTRWPSPQTSKLRSDQDASLHTGAGSCHLPWFFSFPFSFLGLAHRRCRTLDSHVLYVERRDPIQGSAFWGFRRKVFVVGDTISEKNPGSEASGPLKRASPV